MKKKANFKIRSITAYANKKRLRCKILQEREKTKKLTSTYDRARKVGFRREQPVSKVSREAFISSLLGVPGFAPPEDPAKQLDLPVYAISLENFLKVNENSVAAGYNRTFYSDAFLKEVSSKNNTSEQDALRLTLLCKPVQTHHFRSMEHCEMHYRCIITYSARDRAVFDMTVRDYEQTCDLLPPVFSPAA